MKPTSLAFLLLACSLASSLPAAAPEQPNPPASAQWLAAARAAYPLKTCVVSGEELGAMGDAHEYVHRVEGKPDRLVRFCCKSCVKDFRADPEKYLRKIDHPAAPGGPTK